MELAFLIKKDCRVFRQRRPFVLEAVTSCMNSGYAFGVAPCGALNFATGRFAAYCFSDSYTTSVLS